MKKTYKKPIAVIENFSLATSIAGDCEAKTNLPSNNSCGMDFSGVTVFLDTMAGCAGGIEIGSDDFGGDGEFNGICYHVPYGENLFNS